MIRYNYQHTSDIGARQIEDAAFDPGALSINGRLTSRVLAGYEVLDRLLLMETDEQVDTFVRINHSRGDYMAALHLALKIVLPQLKGVTGPKTIMKTKIWNYYYVTTAQWLKKFQKGFNEEFKEYIELLDPPFQKLDETGKLDRKTLFFLDFTLRRIQYYSVEKEKVLHNGMTSPVVAKYSVIARDCPLMAEPLLPESGGEKTGVTLSKGDRIFMHQVTSDKWLYVETEEGYTGYLAMDRDVWVRSAMPEPNATLYEIEKDGETLLGIVNNEYKLGFIDEENDLDYRFYANVLVFLNNPEGEEKKTLFSLNEETGNFDIEDIDYAALYPLMSSWASYIWLLPFNPFYPYVYTPDETTWETVEGLVEDVSGVRWNTWRFVGCRRYSHIWLPSQAYIRYLKDTINKGSLSGNYLAAFEAVDDSIASVVRGSLANEWARGVGFKLGASVGATFGIPLSLDFGVNAYIYRVDTADEDDFTLKISISGYVQGGLDAGWGGGLRIGRAKRPKGNQYRSVQTETQFGVELDASLKLGLKVAVSMEFTFDFKEGKDLLCVFALMLGGKSFSLYSIDKDTKLPGFLSMSHGFDKLLVRMMEAYDIDSMDYLTKFKLVPSLYFHAGYSVTPGFRTIDHLRYNPEKSENFDPSKSDPKDRMTFTKDQLTKFRDERDSDKKYGIYTIPQTSDFTQWEPKDEFEPKDKADKRSPFDEGQWWAPGWIMKYVGKLLGLTFDGTANIFGFEAVFPDGYFIESKTGLRIPYQVDFKVSFDADLIIGGGVPTILKWLEPNVKNWIPGMGVGVSFCGTLYHNKVDIFSYDDFLDPGPSYVEFYRKRGLTQGVTLKFDWDWLDLETIPTTKVDILKKITHFSMSSQLGALKFAKNPAFAELDNFKKALGSHLFHQTSLNTFGFAINSSLSYSFAKDETQIQKFIADIQTLPSTPTNVFDIVFHLLTVAGKRRKIPEQIKWLQYLTTDLDLINFSTYISGGISANIAGKFAAGAKLRGAVGVKVEIVYVLDVKRRILEVIFEDNLEKMGNWKTLVLSSSDLIIEVVQEKVPMSWLVFPEPEEDYTE